MGFFARIQYYTRRGNQGCCRLVNYRGKWVFSVHKNKISRSEKSDLAPKTGGCSQSWLAFYIQGETPASFVFPRREFVDKKRDQLFFQNIFIGSPSSNHIIPFHWSLSMDFSIIHLFFFYPQDH